MNEIIIDKYKNDINKILEYYVNPDDNIALPLLRVFNLVFNRGNVIEFLNEMSKKNNNVFIHSLNVSVLSTIVALKMNLDANQVMNIAIGSLFHDFGLIEKSEQYFDIDIDSLTIDDNFLFKKHTLDGIDKLGDIFSITVKDIILLHHEYNDGTGYPFKRTNLPIEVEIVSICDSYEDMISGIGYRVRKIKDVVSFIRDNKDIKFDGKIVNVLLDIIDN